MDRATTASATSTSTFVFADLAGYTAMTEAHGDELAAVVATEFCRAASALAGEYGGEQVKTIGDAVLLRFHDAAQAVQLGARLVNDLGSRHLGLGVSVGMHTGTAVHRGGDWVGTAVNIAARLGDVAQAGEILLTADTRRAAASAVPDDQIENRGEQRLKHVPRPVEVLELITGSDLPRGASMVDPVCRMALDAGSVTAQADHGGSVVVFCSSQCRSAFLADPDVYVSGD